MGAILDPTEARKTRACI